MLNKNPYLSERALKFYLGSTILATLSTSLGVVVDGIIVGQLLGVDALTSVSLCTPLLQFFATFMFLLNSGNALLFSISMGRGEIQNVKAYFSLALTLNVLFSLLSICVGLFYSDEISAMLCTQEELLPMVSSYARIVLLSSPVYLLLPSMGLFVRADGSPKVTTVALVVANVLNLLFDVVFIKYLDLGVAGSSLATTCGYLVGIAIFLYHLLKSDTNLTFTTSLQTIDKRRAIIMALPIAMTSALMTVRIFGVNRIISDTLGVTGLGEMAVCFNLQMLVSMFVAGVSQSIQPVAGFMIGKHDFRGFGFVSSKALKILIAIVGASVLIFELFPHQILAILGYKEQELIAQATTVVRIVSASFVLYGINYLMMVVHQLSGRTALSLFISVAQPIVVLPIMIGVALVNPEMVWWCFIAGEACVLSVVALYSIVIKLKDRALHPMTLLPTAVESKSLDLSISNATDNDFKAFSAYLQEFLVEHKVDERMKYHIELCCDELLSNILQYAYKGRSERFIDINISLNEEGASLGIKDDGVSFNPLKHKDTENIGLLIVKGVCTSMNYMRNSGQNMIFVEFKR